MDYWVLGHSVMEGLKLVRLRRARPRVEAEVRRSLSAK